jgi:hypothetical protein
MGLLDDFFNREALSHLKHRLAERDAEIGLLNSKIEEIQVAKMSIDTELARVRGESAGRIGMIESLTAELISGESERERIELAVAGLEAASADQHAQAETAKSELRESLRQSEAKAIGEERQRQEISQHFESLRNTTSTREHGYALREEKLAEKSAKLHAEREKFQQQTAALHAKELNWKQAIEPLLQRYEAHTRLDVRERQLRELESALENSASALEEREAGLAHRNCTDLTLQSREVEIEEWNLLLSDKESDLQDREERLKLTSNELIARTDRLEKWSRELYEFQGRVATLDADTAALKKRTLQVDFLENERKTKLAQSEALLADNEQNLQRVSSSLDRREVAVSLREDAAKREAKKEPKLAEEAQAMRFELKQLRAQMRSLSTALDESTSECSKFENKCASLKARNEDLSGLLKDANAVSNSGSSLVHPKVLLWLIENGGPEARGVDNGWLGSSGNGPWDEVSLMTALEQTGYKWYELPDGDLEYLVVGRCGWSKTGLVAQIEAREGRPLWIYSQEMLIAKLLSGRDPFESHDPDILDAFAEDHPALKFLMSLPQPWPLVTTDEPEEVSEVDGDEFGVSESPLHILGYRVGATSDLTATDRRKFLTQTFESRELVFSDDSTDDYIRKWGRAGGAQRLYRMAVHIQTLANGQGRDYRKGQARQDWVDDLKWLKSQHFAKFRTRFSWPAI